MNPLELLSLLFTDYTLRTVTLGAALLGLTSGVLSTFTVLRKQSLLGDAMSHAALPGVVLAFMLTGQKDPALLLLGAALAAWLGALLVMGVTSQTRLKSDTALGIVLAVFFGFGLALLASLQKTGDAQQAGLDRFLFGRAAALVESDVWVMALVGGAALLCVALGWKEFKLLSFDPDYARTLGYPVRALDVLLTTLIIAAIVIGLQTVGVVLMSAMLVAPAAAARQWTHRMGTMALLAGAFGALAGVAGALISATAENIPTGPTIVVCISVIVIVSLLFAPARGIAAAWVQRQRRRSTLHTAAVLDALYQLALHHGDPLHPHPLASLQAALPGENVSGALAALAREGHAQTLGDGWALTPAGVEYVRGIRKES